MAKYRPIYTKIWKDPDFQEYTPITKLLFLYLCTNDSTSDSGIYQITIKTISTETDIPLGTVREQLENGSIRNISYDFDNKIVFVEKFKEYNKGGNPTFVQKGIANDFKTLNYTYLWTKFIEIYPEFEEIIRTVGEPLVNSCGKLSSNPNAISNPKSNAISNPKSSDESENLFSEDSQEIILSKLLFTEIKKRNPGHKKPNFQAWAKDMDGIIRLDKRNPQQIKQVIFWCQNDTTPNTSGFCWCNNILSTKKLRDQFDQLVLKMGESDQKFTPDGRKMMVGEQDYSEYEDEDD